MPQALAVDWNEAKILAIALGVREAARRLGIPEDAMRQRSCREGWLKERNAQNQQIEDLKSQIRADQGLSPVVTKAVDVLKDYGQSTKFHLAKAANKVAVKLSESDVDELMIQGQTACHWTKVAATVHGFGGDGAVSLRLELIARGHGSAASESGATLDAEVEITRPDTDSDDL